MNISVDRNMPLALEAFRTLGDVSIVDGRTLHRDDIKNTTILGIRSTAKIHADLLRDTAVRFVGTATIGTDHMDIPYLEQNGIEWMYSPGCNARSVAEYITAALLHLAVNYNQPLCGQTLGIIGVGNVGKKVAKQANALGMRVLLCDPPRARKENSQSFCDDRTLLAESDFVTLHVPLNKQGPDKTVHMANEDFFRQMKPTAFFLNAARGAVTDTQALIQALDTSQIQAAVIDTWEHEPHISQNLLERAAIGTPHIAGHSFEGKVNGTLMVYEAACNFLQREPLFEPAKHMPKPSLPQTPFPTANSIYQSLQNLVARVYDIAQDDARLRDAKAPDAFDFLRRNYPIRREFACTKVTDIPDSKQAQQIAALGFCLA